jgi:hypothetical protein
VEPGAELHGYDIQILRAPGVTVRGIVRSSGGAPGAAIVIVTLTPIRQAIGFQSHDSFIQDSSGTFELTQVLPGTYTLAAVAPLGDKQLSAQRAIDVGDADLDGIQLMLASPQTVTGTILLPEGRKMPAGLLAVLTPRETRFGRSGGMSQPGSDGTFQMKDVPPGDYDLVLANTALVTISM